MSQILESWTHRCGVCGVGMVVTEWGCGCVVIVREIAPWGCWRCHPQRGMDRECGRPGLPAQH